MVPWRTVRYSAGFRIGITLMLIRIQLFTLMRIRIQLFTSVRIQIRVMIEVMRIYDLASTALHGSIEPRKFLILDFDADPDLAFQSNADPDPDPASKNKTKTFGCRYGSGSETLVGYPYSAIKISVLGLLAVVLTVRSLYCSLPGAYHHQPAATPTTVSQPANRPPSASSLSPSLSTAAAAIITSSGLSVSRVLPETAAPRPRTPAVASSGGPGSEALLYPAKNRANTAASSSSSAKADRAHPGSLFPGTGAMFIIQCMWRMQHKPQPRLSVNWWSLAV